MFLVKPVVTVALAWVVFSTIYGQMPIDSLVKQHHEQYIAYERFREAMTERTWTNLVELGKKASLLIETDRRIIDQYLQEELHRNRELLKNMEKLSLEIALLNKEASIRETVLTEQQSLVRILLIFAGVAFALLIAASFIAINRQKRMKTTRLDLERIWSMKEEPPIKEPAMESVERLKAEIKSLREENERLRLDIRQSTGQRSEAMEALKNEIKARKQVEQEIKGLIDQIKKR